MTDWISVKDRLPERLGIYICFSDGEQWICAFTPYRGWLADEKHQPVTHWKPANVTYYESKP